MDRGAVKTWRKGALSTVIDEIPDERESRFNDVIADPEGRVFCGTMPTKDRLGGLYRLDPDGPLTKLLDGSFYFIGNLFGNFASSCTGIKGENLSGRI